MLPHIIAHQDIVVHTQQTEHSDFSIPLIAFLDFSFFAYIWQHLAVIIGSTARVLLRPLTTRYRADAFWCGEFFLFDIEDDIIAELSHVDT